MSGEDRSKSCLAHYINVRKMSEQIEKVIALEKKIEELEFRIKLDESLYNELANHHKVNRTLISNYRETLKAIKTDNLDKEIVTKIEG